jgi:D-glycero-D-manno-heptose 1,7-bisphosphate phosphatase
MNRAVFFDRDGVLNELVERDGGSYSPRCLSDFKIQTGSVEVTRKTSSLGYLNIVISNQPDIARGLLEEEELDRMTRVLIDQLVIDDVFYCMHDDADSCDCRKPAPGLFIQAADKWEIDLQRSYMIGDTWKDTQAAMEANVKCLLLETANNEGDSKDNIINSLGEIFKFIG